MFDRLRKEVVDTFGTNPQSAVNFTELTTCRYLQWMINETVRIAAVVPMNERMAQRDTVLPRGGGPDGQSPIFVAKGVQVLIPTYSMQHRADIWGADVEEYRPERWQDRKFGWDFIPFGGGARQCLGRKCSSFLTQVAMLTSPEQFARTEISYTVVRLLQIFDRIENMEPPGPIKMHHTIENRSGTGVQVRLHAATPDVMRKLTQDELDLGLGAERRESVGQ